MSVMASVAGDDGLDSICRQKIVPYQVSSTFLKFENLEISKAIHVFCLLA
jgi:hypothetical protein